MSSSRLSDATWTAFTEGLRFIVIPLVLIDLITRYYPLLETPFMSDIRLYIMFFGGMIAAASTLEVSKKPGSYARVLFGLSTLAFLCMWIFVILGGGIATFTYGPYFVRFDMSKIVYIMLFGVSLKALLVMSTFSQHRSGFLEAQKKPEARARPAARHQTSGAKGRPRAPTHSFESMSRVAYEVTPDDSVGFSPPRQAETETPRARTLRSSVYRICPICGATASASDKICKHCGAWF